MPIDDLLGRIRPLVVRRLGDPGAFLSEDLTSENSATYLLPRAEVPPETAVGDTLEVFVSLDSEDRPIATLRAPYLRRDDVGFLEVTAITPIGAFLDWGLPKELLLPFREQTREVREGDRLAVGVFVDNTGRMCATMRIRELLQDGGDFTVGEWVEGEAWRIDPALGLFVIVERGFLGLLPASEPHRLDRGEKTKFRVSRVYPDRKIELSLRGMAHEELENDGETILRALAHDPPPKISDRSSPDDLRDLLGLSKKAFKRAAGRLLRDGLVDLDKEGYLTIKATGSRRASS
jgi:uncharacterized protein